MKKIFRRMLGIITATAMMFSMSTGIFSASAADPIKVACVGDSITEGSQSSNASIGSYPAQLQKILGTANYTVKNFGRSGKSVLFNKDRSYNVTSQYTDSIAYKADIVIFMLGTNDVNYYNKDHFNDGNGNFDEAAFNTQFKADMTTLINAYKAVSETVYIANTPTAFRTNDENNKLTAIAKLQAEVAQATGCELIDVRGFTSSMKNGVHYADGLHPNDTGYTQLAQFFNQEIFGGKIYNVTVNTEANVNVKFGSQTLSSGSTGSVVFPSAPGTYDLIVSSPGYRIDFSEKVTVENSDLTIDAPIGTRLENLAYRKPTTTKFISGQNKNLPSDAVDGNTTSTRWGTPTNLDGLTSADQSKYADNNAYHADRVNQWLTVDLGEKKLFNQVVFYWEASYAKDYMIQVSDDGTSFTTIKTVTNSPGGLEVVDLPDTGARYVRMQGITESSGTWGYSMWEMEIYYIPIKTDDTEDSDNLALKKETTASHVYKNQTTNIVFDKKFITDGNNDNTNESTYFRWNAGKDENVDCWIYVDLGATERFNEAVLYWNPHNCPSKYSIQISDDASAWTTVATDSCGIIKSDDYKDYIRTLSFSTCSARYVRIYVAAQDRKSTDSGYWVSLVEFELYRKAGGITPEVTVSDNLALNKDAKAHNVRRAGYEATKATDGNNNMASGTDFNSGSRWVCNPENKDRWLYVDLGTATTFNRVTLYFNYNNAPKEYRIQVCDSVDASGNGNWQTVATQTTSVAANSKNTSDYIFTTDFDTATARYIRLLVPQGVANNNGATNNDKYFLSVVEFEVYNVSGVNASDVKMFKSAVKENNKCDMIFLTNVTKTGTANDKYVKASFKVTNASGKSNSAILKTNAAYDSVTISGVAYGAGDFAGGTSDDYIIGFMLENLVSGYKVEYYFYGEDASGNVTWTGDTNYYTVK